MQNKSLHTVDQGDSSESMSRMFFAAPAFQPMRLHWYLPNNDRGTLLPPYPLKPQRGHVHYTREQLSPISPRKAELPLLTDMGIPTPTR
jgi:hypothetical protein